MCSEVVDPCSCVSCVLVAGCSIKQDLYSSIIVKNCPPFITSNSTSKMEQLNVNVLCLRGTLWVR